MFNLKINCVANKKTCEKLNVKGYPTLMIFRYGESPSRYKGPRHAGINCMNWSCQVDCSASGTLCKDLNVKGYPSLKVFRRGVDGGNFAGKRNAGGCQLVHQPAKCMPNMDWQFYQSFSNQDHIFRYVKVLLNVISSLIFISAYHIFRTIRQSSKN